MAKEASEKKNFLFNKSKEKCFVLDTQFGLRTTGEYYEKENVNKNIKYDIVVPVWKNKIEGGWEKRRHSNCNSINPSDCLYYCLASFKFEYILRASPDVICSGVPIGFTYDRELQSINRTINLETKQAQLIDIENQTGLEIFSWEEVECN